MVYINCLYVRDHQEKHNKDELTRGAGGRIKEVEECFVDEFLWTGETKCYHC